MTYWQAVSLLFLVWIISTQSQKTGIEIKQLHEGLFVEKRGGLYYQAAEWVILTTISSLPPTSHIQTYATALKAHILKVSSSFPQLKENWLVRISWCEEYLQQFITARPKRAPLGFIGKLSHTLFGTVTEDELKAYKDILAASSATLNKTVHRVNLLLSAVKKTEINVIANSAHLFKLQRYLHSMSRAVFINFAASKRAIELLELKNKLEHSVVSLEQSVRRVLSYFALRRRQINSIYHRSLTQDILPQPQLEEILRHARRLGYHTMPAPWYYANCRVAPVWGTLDDITFRVSLPLHDDQSYLRYTLKSIPYPVKPGFKAQVKVKSEVAYSSVTGSLFEPILCVGDQIQVCRGGPLYQKTSFNCERALISRDPVAKRHCSVRITPSNSTTIQESTPGFYTISTFTIATKLHCAAHAEKNVKFTSGVYLISLNQSCSLRGQDWTLPGLNKFRSPIHIKNLMPPISLNTVFRQFTALQMERIARMPHWTPIPHLEVLSVDPLAYPPRFFPMAVPDSLPWINATSIGLITCIVIISVLSIKFYPKCRRNPRLNCFFRRRQDPTTPCAIELQKRAPPPQENPLCSNPI